MAERRMFAKTIIDSDAFLDMPLSTQALYFHLSMRADDEGFINNPKKIQRMIGASDDDMKVLIAKSFVIPFESGIVVIKHWKIHNYIRGDRIKETVYAEERNRLEVKDNGAYTLAVTATCPSNVSQLTDNWQHRLGKDSIGEDSIGEEREMSDTPPQLRLGIYNNVILSQEELDALKADYPAEYEKMIDNLSLYMKSSGKVYKDHYATIRKWKREDAEKAKEKQGAKKKISGFLDYEYKKMTPEENKELVAKLIKKNERPQDSKKTEERLRQYKGGGKNET